MVEELLLIVFGFLVGMVAAFMGIGGGVLFVPILVLIFGFDMRRAIGTSLLAILITAASSTIAYLRERKINFRLGLLLEAASVPGAVLGAYFAAKAPVIILKTLFIVLLVGMSIKIVRGNNIPEVDDFNASLEKRGLAQALALSFLAGFLSASLGIGGGVLKVPILVTTLKIPIHQAIGTSVFMILITVATGLSQHLYYGHVDVLHGTLLGIGAMFGAQLGVRASLKTKPRKLRVLFSVLLLAIAIRMLLA